MTTQEKILEAKKLLEQYAPQGEFLAYINSDEAKTLNKSFKSNPLGEWTTYKIGIHNSRKEDGFVKVYKDDQLIMNYEGITYDWNGNYTGSHIRIGPYRDSDPEKKGYPPQSIHYDDFIVVSDKKTLDQYLK